MTDFFVFGGTSEGRAIAQLLQEKGLHNRIFVATEYGEALLEPSEHIHVHTGRLDEEAMRQQIRTHRPRIVVDATHPYADVVSRTLQKACLLENATYLRIERESSLQEGCRYFENMDTLCAWLNTVQGNIFSSLGAKEVNALRQVQGFQERIWLRILPFEEGLRSCLDAGFPAKHIFCMQGPFSRELNRALFNECNAKILLTKDSGKTGGFPEKLEAAKELNMEVAIVQRPKKATGITLKHFKEKLEEDTWQSLSR